MSLVEQFKAWVAEQPPEQTINHFSWNTCAMGEFATTLPPNDEGEPVYGYDVGNEFQVVYGDDAYNTIGNGGRGSHYHFEEPKEPVPMANYGELSVWLNSLEPITTN